MVVREGVTWLDLTQRPSPGLDLTPRGLTRPSPPPPPQGLLVSESWQMATRGRRFGPAGTSVPGPASDLADLPGPASRPRLVLVTGTICGVFPSGECVQDSEEPAIQAKAGLECRTGWADLTLGPA